MFIIKNIYPIYLNFPSNIDDKNNKENSVKRDIINAINIIILMIIN